jgi:DNA-binding transcriptional LysR family regulator
MRKLDNYLTARQFRHFSEIADCGSLNKAAEKLGQTQSSLTRSLRQLEESVDAKLMERGPKGIALTQAGTILLECYRRVALETRLATQAIEHASETKNFVVRLGAAPSFGLSILPKAMETLRDTYPNTQFQIRHATPDAMLTAVTSGEIDIYLGPIIEADFEVGIITEPLAAVPSRVYARKDHPIANKKMLTGKDLLAFRWVSLLSTTTTPLPGNWRDKLTNFAYENGLNPPRVDFETTSVVGALNIVTSGNYLVCLSDLLSAEAAMRDLTPLSLKEPLTQYKSGIVYRSPVNRDVHLRAFLDVLRDVSKAAISR